MPNDFDFIVELFFKNFLGKSRLLDGAVELISDSYTLGSVLFVALLWLAWFKDKRDNSRIRLLKGGVGVLLAGLLSRALQFVLAFHYRPLYNSDLRLPWPIGVAPGTLNHWNSFPSDHAALFFALATLIWVGDPSFGGVRVHLGRNREFYARLSGLSLSIGCLRRSRSWYLHGDLVPMASFACSC
jgi:membrane-associated phospholipid phosphatase